MKMMENAKQKEIKRIRILDVPVDMVGSGAAMKVFRQLMGQKDGPCRLIVTPNSEIILNATRDPELKSLIEEAGLIIPDGIGLVYASRIIRQPLSERVTGIDFLSLILMEMAETGQSVFLIGSRPADETGPSVAQRAAAAMEKAFPGLKIAGTRDGYFQKEEEAAVVEEINRSGASFLCAALGSPKQEKFIYSHREEFTSVRVGMGVGGSLDVWAGAVKRAPEFYRNHGLEWLYRLIQEPSRYKRMAKLPLFMLKVLADGASGGGSRKTDCGGK